MSRIGYQESINYKCLLGLEPQTKDFSLYYCGIEYCKPKHSYGSERRFNHLIHFVIEGSGTFTLHHKTYQLQPHQAFYIPPDDTDYFYQADGTDPWVYAWIGFDGTRALEYLEQTALSGQHPVCALHVETEKIVSLVQEILDAKALTKVNELKRAGCLYRIFSLLIESNYKEPVSEELFHYSPDAYSAYAKQMIDTSFDQLSISDIIQTLGIHRSYLYSLFRERYQISPKQYLIKCRLESAAAKLKSTSTPVREIAESVGYEDPLNFSRLFKKYFGVSPAEYRSADS